MIIEAVTRAYLEDKTGIKCYTEKESNMKKPYCLIEKTGGSSSNYIHQATITIQSYSDSLAKASALNETVKQAMNEIVTKTNISRCELNSDYNYTAQDTKEYRYQAVFDITYM